MASSAMAGSIPVAEKQYAPWISPRTQLCHGQPEISTGKSVTYPASGEPDAHVNELGEDIFGRMDTGCSIHW